MTLRDLERKLKIIIRKNLKDNKPILENLKVFFHFEKEYGDYSTNLLFLLKKFAPEKENEIIEKIKNELKNDFERIEVINGYLNFYLAKIVLIRHLRDAYKNLKKTFQINYGRKQKLNLDYVSANPTGPLTLGNVRGACLGDALANILNLVGFKVTKEYYVNDRGKQIEILGKTILAHLGKINWSEEFYQGEYLKELAEKFKEKIKETEQPEKIGKKIADDLLKNYIQPSLKKFGTFHHWFFFESDLYKGDLKEKVLKILKKKNLLETRDGALFLKLTKLGEEKDEVLIRKNGEPTYFFSDLLHYYYKFFLKRNKIEILIVASDHLHHVQRLKSALIKIFKIKPHQFRPIVYQFVHLKKGETLLKMSKRKGIYVTLDDLMEILNPGIIRFFFLQKSIDATIELDLELARKESEENPYWYVMYAYARLNRILEKAKEKKLKVPSNLDAQKFAFIISGIENARELLRSIYKFKDLIFLIAKEHKTHLLIDYLLDFAKKVHYFYEKERILDGGENLIQKLAFIEFLKNYLAFVFSLLPIKPIEKI